MTSIQELRYTDVLARMRTDSFLDNLEKTRFDDKENEKPTSAAKKKTRTRTYEPITFHRTSTKVAAKSPGTKKRKSACGGTEEAEKGARRPEPGPREASKKPRFAPPPFKPPVYLEDITFFNKATTRDGVDLLANNAPFRGHDGMKIVLDGVEYRTEEHAVQAAKFLAASRVSASKERRFFLSDFSDMFRGDRFATFSDALVASKRVRLDSVECAEWKDRRVEIQKRICMYKLSQYVDVRNALRYTKGTALVFSSPYMKEDTFWGMKKTGTERLAGKNMLGRIWMQLRDDPF